MIAIAAVMAVIALGGYLVYSYASMSYGGETARVYITPGSTRQSLGDSLRSALGEDYGDRVASILNTLGGADGVAPGSFKVESGEKAWKLARRIKNGRQDPVRFTFNNVRTIAELSSKADAQLMLTADEFIAAADSVMTARGVSGPMRAAYFLPDTYEFYWTDKPSKIVDKIIANHDRFWTDERVKKAREAGLTPEEVSTLASIVEEETNKADERPKVARLYLNRLSRGIKLQADPTVKFALGDFSIRRITHQMLSTQSAYNTYIVGGLPPGPIRLPMTSTLDAVINAPAHDYIYMCAKEDFSGYHNFTADYSTHIANARRYQQALNSRGIKAADSIVNTLPSRQRGGNK